MIDWRIAKIASSGIRGIRLRLRQPMSEPVGDGRSEASRRRELPVAGAVIGVLLPGRLGLGLLDGDVAGQAGRRRRASGGGGRCRRCDPGVVEFADRRATSDCAPPSAGTVTRRVCSSRVAAPIPMPSRISRARDQSPVVDHDLDALAADLRLQLVGGAAGDDLAVVDDGDRVGQLVGLLEVLRRQQERRPFADERPG